MSETIIMLASFIIALLIGIYLGKSIFSANSKTEKASLDEKINGLLAQIEQFKLQVSQTINEREVIRSEKESLAIQFSKKEVDFENLWERNKEQKEEVNQLQEKFTKEFENLANKILEEKTNKFTEQNKENMKNILSPLQDKIVLFEKKVEDTHKESIDYHAALRQQILGLSKMNEQNARKLGRTCFGARSGKVWVRKRS
jgi:DNA recombination protein RmuC